jgi:hypothetical protein
MYSAHMSEFTKESLQKYLGKYVSVEATYWYWGRVRVIAVEDTDLVIEYFHHIKTPEDGLMRDHWIAFSAIKSIELSEVPAYL